MSPELDIEGKIRIMPEKQRFTILHPSALSLFFLNAYLYKGKMFQCFITYHTFSYLDCGVINLNKKILGLVTVYL